MTATKLQPSLSSTTCPYCGVELGSANESSNRCFSCRGLLDPLSRQASQNDMGPWFIRDDKSPFRPGCSYEVLRALASKGRLSRETVIRGPSTRQFWMTAAQTPGIGHLFGSCHSCGTECSPTDVTCDECHASFVIESNRQHLGLGPIHLIPGAGISPPSNPSRLKSLVGDSIDEEQLIAASATTLPRDELPEANPEFRSSYTLPRRGDAGVISSAELQALENKLSTSRLLVLVTSLVAGLCLAATVLIVLDIKKDLGLGLGRALQPAAALPPPPDTSVDNMSTPVISTPPPTDPATPAPDPAENTPRPKTRGIAGSPAQLPTSPSALPSTTPPATTPGPHDKPTPDGEKIPIDGGSSHDPRWNQVVTLLQAGDRDSVLKALTLVNDLEAAKLPPPAARPDLPQAVRTKAALMTLSPASPSPSPK
jgi:hypothetical protein